MNRAHRIIVHERRKIVKDESNETLFYCTFFHNIIFTWTQSQELDFRYIEDMQAYLFKPADNWTTYTKYTTG
jgi:hypothetical protein